MPHSLLMFFLQKSLLDPQCILSLEIFDDFCWIEVTVRFRFIVRVYGLGFGLGLDINNSKKIKKNRKPSHGILLFDLPPGKNYKHEL